MPFSIKHLVGKLCLLIVVATMPFPIVISAQTYATKRLETIDMVLRKNKHKCKVVRRVDSSGEVQHIGLPLFSNEVRQSFPSPTYDFLERHLLELNIYNNNEMLRLAYSNSVTFTTGDYRVALTLDTLCSFSNEVVDYYRYRSTWSRGEDVLLQMVYDMNWQMMSGCSIGELEEGFVRRLSHHSFTPLPPLQGNGKSIITPVINNRLFFDEKDGVGERHYLFTPKQLSRSVCNLMLADDLGLDDIDIKLTIDRYNYKTDTLTLPLSLLLNYCRSSQEGCMPYFGLKSSNIELTKGVLMLSHKDKGYMHIISVEVPTSVIANKRGTIEGKAILYIPLHNVKKEYLNLSEYDINP